jgi:outer membrane protein
MKKLLIAVAALALGMTACNNTANTANNNEDAAATTTGKIAYFFVDQVVAKYAFAIDQNAEFQAEYAKATKQLQANESAIEKDYTKLQKKVADLQEKVNKVLITRANAEVEMQKLQAEEMKIQERINNHQQNAQKVASELSEKEMVINNQIVNNVYEYVAKLNADLRYDIVLSSTTTGGPIINANPALDITAEIVEGLNAAYKK